MTEETNNFKLHYHCSNGGDGSVSVHFHQTEEQAEKADEAMTEGWGESSASYVELSIQNGKIVRLKHEWDAQAKKFNKFYIPLEQI